MRNKIRTFLEIQRNEGIVTALNSTESFLKNLPRYIYDEYIITPRKGRYLFDYDWDLAIILDACRYDLAEEFIKKNTTELDIPEQVYSVGSKSPQWVRRTFSHATNEQLQNTTYVTGNVYSNKCPDQVKRIERVWEQSWDPQLETVPPRPVTDRTIELMRDDGTGRYIVHYMQPHLPSVHTSSNETNGWLPLEGSPRKNREGGGEWKAAKEGNPKQVTKAYKNNLRPVIKEVELLLQNVNASKVIITADHGNYLGEDGRWGHPAYHTHSAVRHVPWWETTATDNETHTPNSRNRPQSSISREDKLESLGYIQ